MMYASIQSMITKACTDEDRTGRLRQAIDNLPIPGTTAESRGRLFEFVRRYIKDTPGLMEAASVAAAQAGIAQSMQPLLDTALGYWRLPNEVIPDHLGLLGLVDDAYFSHGLIQVFSDNLRAQTGHPLLSVDLGQANAIVRGIIGEPAASQLDAAVVGAFQVSALQSAMGMLSGLGGPLAIPSRDYGGCSLDEYVDIQMGAAGIF